MMQNNKKCLEANQLGNKINYLDNKKFEINSIHKQY